MVDVARSCEECIHVKICPLCASANKFLNQFSPFWTQPKVVSKHPEPHPVGPEMACVISKHCQHYGKDSEHGPSLHV